jgi:hypothetical protein
MIHSIAWRRSPERVSIANQVINSRGMQDMLAVMELDHPSKNIPALRDGFGATEQLGIIRGYEMCLNQLKALATPAPIAPPEIPTTWGTENEPEEKK